MKKLWMFKRIHWITLIAYSAIFPLSNIVGGTFALIGIVSSLPFQPIAWLAGLASASAFGTDKAYLVGATISIFIQAYLVMITWMGVRTAQREPSI